ncbi:MAG: hypothetical protein DWQ09_16010 [Proteobacteria bacterium]|nr:MAG: hypothetical protein DWQ09_16010 [Pseudomonadota bacterium]
MPARSSLLSTCALLALATMASAHSQSSVAPPAPAAKHTAKHRTVSAPSYQIDTESGAVRFGDGRQGRRPPTGRTQTGNPQGAAGGADAETVDTAKQRIPRTLRHRERAVGRSDYRPLANPNPGVTIHRATVTPSPSGQSGDKPPTKHNGSSGFANNAPDTSATETDQPTAK